MRISKAGQDLFFRIEQSKKPMVACVNGFALGGGCELAMSCHIRIASENAKFAQPEINLGLIPGYGGTQRLVQLIGKGRALELMLTGNMIDATTALAYGLVNRVVPIAQLLPVAYEMLHTIQSKAPVAIAACIKAANAAGNNGYVAEQTAFAECFATADKIEGVNAFLQKRKPHFTGH
jgi:enoyl-CoA hydratase